MENLKSFFDNPIFSLRTLLIILVLGSSVRMYTEFSTIVGGPMLMMGIALVTVLVAQLMRGKGLKSTRRPGGFVRTLFATLVVWMTLVLAFQSQILVADTLARPSFWVTGGLGILIGFFREFRDVPQQDPEKEPAGMTPIRSG